MRFVRHLVTLAAAAGLFPRASAVEKSEASDALFTGPVIHEFKIEVAEPALGTLKKDNRAYVRGKFWDGTNVFHDVGIHLKGMGSFRPLEEKPSFAVKFDKFTPHQHYCGLTKIMLNNSSQDSTYLAELLATQMFRDAGVPAARVTHAFVQFNGRKLGLYVLVEAMNKEFLKQHFANSRGNLYEAYLQDIDQKLDQDGGPDTSQADLKTLLEATKVQNPAERWQRLQQVLEVDRYVAHLVVELFTSHTDGYALNRNNYRLYHDPTTSKFVFIAHGVDWGFANAGISIRPPQNSIVTRAVLQTRDGRRLYQERLGQLFTNVFRLEVVTNRVNDAVARLKRAASTPNEAKDFEHYGAEMRHRLIARQKNIAEQLAQPQPEPLKFDTNGVGRLAGWRAQKLAGDATLDQTQWEDKATLHVRIDQGNAVASWRAKVSLPEGQYRFEGRARTGQVVGLTNAVERGNGAGLRVSGEKRTNQLTGDSIWTPLEHEFAVAAGEDEKELVCELRASKGEVWFDAASLRLRKR